MSIEFKPNWAKYPKLAKVFEHRPEENVYWDDLRELLSDARADAIRFVEDVKVEELRKARAKAVRDVAAELRKRDAPLAEHIMRLFGDNIR